MYIIRNTQDLDTLLEERCEKEYNGGGCWEDKDKIVLNAKGEWFDKNVLCALGIYGSNPVHYQYVTKIKPEDKHYIKIRFLIYKITLSIFIK